MKAAVLHSANTAIEIEEVDIIEPRVGEVRVSIKYCGLCHSDLGFVNGKMPMAGPLVLGHEAAGVVESVGIGVTHLSPGDHVVLTPAPPCGQCYFCQRNQHNLCVNAMSIMTALLPDGSTGLSQHEKTIYRGCGMGALAEQVVLPATGAVKIDKDIPLHLACLTGCALQTGVGAVLNTANMETGASCLITGLGGVGMAAVQGARIAGATTIIVSDPVAERRELALELGATHAIDPSQDDLTLHCQQLTQGIGVDYAFECAGKALLIEQCIAQTRMGGSIICVGSPAVEESLNMPAIVGFQVVEKKLCGCLLGSCNSLYEIPRLLRLWRQGLLNLDAMVTSQRPFSEINEGFADLAASRGIRTVIAIGDQ